MDSSLWQVGQLVIHLQILIHLQNSVFICCHTFKWIPNIYELHNHQESNHYDWPSWIRRFSCKWILSTPTFSECISNLSSFLTTLNGSINVFIYFFKHRVLVAGILFSHRCEPYNNTNRRRSSWQLHRNPSKSLPLYLNDSSPSSTLTTLSSIKRFSSKRKPHQNNNRIFESTQTVEETFVWSKWIL